ncbi:hypothetical protein A1Z85_RS10875 [Acinetobacter baumannii]|uniref:hypothetical protein n=1 Tax=Acinetobacter baumannii TaxID=470 RepID=UPI00103F7A66|nr:hypothetical protein [Acinetobacter baumannii]EHU1441299.1 hypothetical protein [Acinetobacter baumannii]EHU1809119.1 hypothetical protein [Acinetobacter baumannii]EHU2698507.1 hypothetical protein [Acinetobacter baumannii]TPT82200.1 hypothetical protein FJU55_16960 [Acinetobacter baumannii]
MSAFATILATLVAMNFFKDWRDQYNSRLFEKLKDNFNRLYSALEFKLELYFFEVKINQNDEIINKSKIRLREVKTSLNELKNELDYYENILSKLENNKREMRETLDIVKKNLEEVDKLLNLKTDRRNNYNSFIKTELDEIFQELENSKTILIRDINSIILDYLKK